MSSRRFDASPKRLQCSLGSTARVALLSGTVCLLRRLGPAPRSAAEERAVGHYDFCENPRCENPDVEAGRKLLELLDVMKKEFERTANPVHAWEAWRFCRECSLPIPDWVISYLDRSGEAIQAIGDGRVAPVRHWQGDALKRRKGPPRSRQAKGRRLQCHLESIGVHSGPPREASCAQTGGERPERLPRGAVRCHQDAAGKQP